MRVPLFDNVHGHEYLCTEELVGETEIFWGGSFPPKRPKESFPISSFHQY